MSETTALLWMLLIITLRLGLPFILILAGGNLINAWVDRHQDQTQPA